jgi:hypothetical protein
MKAAATRAEEARDIAPLRVCEGTMGDGLWGVQWILNTKIFIQTMHLGLMPIDIHVQKSSSN